MQGYIRRPIEATSHGKVSVPQRRSGMCKGSYSVVNKPTNSRDALVFEGSAIDSFVGMGCGHGPQCILKGWAARGTAC